MDSVLKNAPPPKGDAPLSLDAPRRACCRPEVGGAEKLFAGGYRQTSLECG
jgi:hypothetical protein